MTSSCKELSPEAIQTMVQLLHGWFVSNSDPSDLLLLSRPISDNEWLTMSMRVFTRINTLPLRSTS